MTDDEPPETPPDARSVARRCLILSAVTCRGYIDHGRDSPKAQALHARLVDWLRQLGLRDEAEPAESAILAAPLGELSKRQVISATWVVEGLAVLAWALRQFPLPELSEELDPHAVTDAAHLLSDDAARFVATAVLRPPEQLEACRELMYAVHCRLCGVRRQARLGDFDAWIEDAWLEQLGIERASLVGAGELRIDAQPITELDDKRWHTCESIIRERHRATIWLQGEHPTYRDISVDT
jgi:hypothetical protein